ncbi:MAG: oligosaccharide flippase family protein, partial [Pseudomonadota bacterium]
VYYWPNPGVGQKNDYLPQVWILMFFLAVFSLVATFLFRPVLGRLLGLDHQIMPWLFLCAFFFDLNRFYEETCIAQGKKMEGSLFIFGFEILKAILFLSVILNGGHVQSLFIAYFSLSVVKFLLSVYLGFKKGYLRLSWHLPHWKVMASYALPISLFALLDFTVDKMDQLILFNFLEKKDFVIYSLGLLVIPPLVYLEDAVLKVAIPQLSQCFHEKNITKAPAIYRKAVAQISWVIIPSVFGLIIYARPIMEILYTKTYMASAFFLQIFALSYFCLCFPHDAVLRASGQGKRILLNFVLVTPLYLVILLPAVKCWGGVGALICLLFTKLMIRFL